MDNNKFDEDITKMLRSITGIKTANWVEYNSAKTHMAPLEEGEKMIQISSMGLWVAYKES